MRIEGAGCGFSDGLTGLRGLYSGPGPLGGIVLDFEVKPAQQGQNSGYGGSGEIEAGHVRPHSC